MRSYQKRRSLCTGFLFLCLLNHHRERLSSRLLILNNMANNKTVIDDDALFIITSRTFLWPVAIEPRQLIHQCRLLESGKKRKTQTEIHDIGKTANMILICLPSCIAFYSDH